MMAILPPLGVGLAVVLVSAFLSTERTKKVLAKHTNKTQVFPKALGSLILVANASEIFKVLEHTTVVHIVAALLLFTIWMAAKSGAESELH